MVKSTKKTNQKGAALGETRTVAKIDRIANTAKKAKTASAPKTSITLERAKIDRKANVEKRSEDDKPIVLMGSVSPKAKNYKIHDSSKDSNSTKAILKSKQGRGADLSMYEDTARTIGMDPDEDAVDALDLLALNLLDLIQTQVLAFQNLTRQEKSLLYRYFQKYNPVIARVLDLHTDLPLSKLRLQAPKDVPEIVADFVMVFFQKILDHLNFDQVIRDLVLLHLIHGRCDAIVEDFFQDKDRELQEFQEIAEQTLAYSDDDKKYLDEIEDRYSKDPEAVGLADRLKYIKTKFSSFYVHDYNGPERIQVIYFYNIVEYFVNEDIDFEAIKYQLSPSLQSLIQSGESTESLMELGYTEGLLKIALDEDSGPSHAILTNDTLSGLPFLLTLRRFDDTSIIHRVIDEALEWDVAKKAFKQKVSQIGKVGRIVSADGIAEDQVTALRAEVALMLEDPNHAIVSNFAIDWNEVNSFIKDEIIDLIDTTQNLLEQFGIGLGMPDSLISGDSTYSGDNIKLEILNTEYLSFKIRLQNLIENKLFKPIALRKGFVLLDSWGTPTLIYPRLQFNRLAIRSEDQYDILFSLYQKGSLPVSIIYDILNLDADDITRALKNDLFTLKDATLNDLLRDLLRNASDDVFDFAARDIRDKIMLHLGLRTEEEIEKERAEEDQRVEEQHEHDTDPDTPVDEEAAKIEEEEKNRI
ncbi:MAG TPA: hypothetical protein ENI23_12220 [bacterium]|nr:hypothetical protein [bacterium]